MSFDPIMTPPLPVIQRAIDATCAEFHFRPDIPFNDAGRVAEEYRRLNLVRTALTARFTAIGLGHPALVSSYAEDIVKGARPVVTQQEFPRSLPVGLGA